MLLTFLLPVNGKNYVMAVVHVSAMSSANTDQANNGVLYDNSKPVFYTHVNSDSLLNYPEYDEDTRVMLHV